MAQPQLISHLDALMKEQGMTGKQLSEASGVSDSVITRLRRNHFTQLDMNCVAKLCVALKAGPGDLFTIENASQ